MMNNSASFEFLYRQYYEPIYKFCFRFLNNRESALDVTQETFIKMYVRMSQRGLEIENTKSWLYKVAGNLCLNLLNNNKRHLEIENQLESKSIENTTPENILLHDEKTELLKKAISHLKPENRMLVMMYQDGLSYKEMSDATGIKLSSVGNTLWRAINKISENIKLQTNE